MTKEVFDAIVAKSKGDPFIIYGDNMQVFLCHMEGNYLIQDDTNVYCIRVNSNAHDNAGISQHDAPFEIVVFNYDEIQYIKIFPKTENLKDIFTNTQPVFQDQTLEQIMKEVLTSPIITARTQRGTEASTASGTPYGAFTGSVVTIGKDPDRYTQMMQDSFNEAHNQP